MKSVTTTARGEERGLRVLGAFQLALVLGAAVLFAYALHGSMPYNAVHLPLEERLQAHVYLPEGWKFFTRNPQEEDPTPYVRDADGRWKPAASVSYAGVGSKLGLDRTVRARGVEFGLIVSAIPKSAWQSCDEAPLACLSRTQAAMTMTNESPNPSLCGTVGVVSQRPVPWAWTRSGRPVEMPSKVAVVEVRC